VHCLGSFRNFFVVDDDESWSFFTRRTLKATKFLQCNLYSPLRLNNEHTKSNIADTEIHKNINITGILIATNAVFTS